MKLGSLTRLYLGAALVAAVGVLPALAREPQPGAAAGKNHIAVRPGGRPPTKPANQEHLQQWMELHKNLSPQQQIHELDKEPGFRDLPSQTQQNYRDRLIQLNSMTPQQRDRILERNEILERMSTHDRQQYRSAVQNFATMAADRRRLMARAVLDLRAMPPEQRQSVIDSDRFRGQFTEAERSTLGTLLAGEPYTGSQASQ
ncbi:MAG: hypothetical protein NVSMB62_09380 [Acidobacteriaceae bacterium]